MLIRCSCSRFAFRALESRFYSRKIQNERKDVLVPLETFTRRLIESSAAGNAGHKHRDGVHLWSTIPQVTKPHEGVPSQEKAQFMGEMTPLFEMGLGQYESMRDDFPPGTFVEIRRNRVVTFGVILQMKIIEARQHALTLTFTGEVWPHLTTDITYSIPSFVPLALISRCGSEYETANTAETVARLQVVEQVRIFARRQEKLFIAMGRGFNRLYEAVRHPDPERWAEITTPDATRHLDVRKPAPVLALFSVHSHLMSRPLYFVADPRNHRSTHRFSVRPLSHIQTILQVNDWIRNYDPAYDSFLSKARLVVEEARRLRQSHWDGPPVQAETSFQPWSSTDLVFLRYLQQSMRTTRTTQDDPYETALPNIVKQLGLYSEHVVGPGLTQTILCELGVIAPWEDIVMRTPELRLDIAPVNQSKEAQTLNELVEFNLNSPGMPVTPSLQKNLVNVFLEGSTELYQKDPHKDLRHDFGDLPVYVVDDIGAHELDDGISIEPVAGEEGSYWTHVHIADPTTLIPPGHVIDLRARTSAATMYSAHRTWPMLPHALTQPLHSLGTRKKGEMQEVLTFSIKVNSNGDLLDYKVRAGLVRNVVILQYGQVDLALGMDPSFLSYPLLGTRVPERCFDRVPEVYHSDLQRLYDIANTISLRTVRENPILTYAFPEAGVEFETPLPSNPILSPTPVLWKGHPTMTYHVERLQDSDRTFRRIVAEYMKLACRAASRFCIDNGLPAMRRASTPLRAANEKDMADVVAMRSPTGHVEPIECIKRELYAPVGEPTLEPLAHWSLAVPKGEGYCRVTSPLRRYSDLMMHWQIKHQLLPTSKRTTTGPLFPAEYLRPVMFRLFDKEKTITNASKLYTKYWALFCLKRYIHSHQRKHGLDFNCFPGLEGQTVGYVGLDTRNVTGQVPVNIPSLGIRGLLKGIDQKAPLPVGTTVSVKISDIQLGLAPIMTLAPA